MVGIHRGGVELNIHDRNAEKPSPDCGQPIWPSVRSPNSRVEPYAVVGGRPPGTTGAGAMALSQSDPPEAHIETLTDREREILGLFAEGFQNKLIAARLSIATETVKAHAKSIFRKLGVTNRVQAVIWFRDHIPPKGDSGA